MQRVLSTYRYVHQPLAALLLAEFARAGIGGLEVFCSPLHFDYRSPQTVRELAGALSEHGIALHSLHSPTERELAPGRQSGVPLSISDPERIRRVDAVDQVKRALEVAERNLTANRQHLQAEVDWVEGDAFQILRDWSEAAEKFNTIVLDPPAFAKTKRDLDSALRGYKELNLRALKMLRTGGILVTCSCSYHVGQADFLDMLASAALDAHRTLRLIEVRGQAKDHPILLSVPESSYLKCVIASVS